MGDNRPTHARVPELDDMLGDLCGRRVYILRLEKLADLVAQAARAARLSFRAAIVSQRAQSNATGRFPVWGAGNKLRFNLAE